MKIVLEINRLPKTTNSIGKASIWASHKERHDWRDIIRTAYLLEYGRLPEKPIEKSIVTFTRFSSKEPDVDNLYSSWKHCLDSLVFNRLIEDDKPSNIDLKCKWEKIGPSKGKIRIEIEGLDT